VPPQCGIISRTSRQTGAPVEIPSCKHLGMPPYPPDSCQIRVYFTEWECMIAWFQFAQQALPSTCQFPLVRFHPLI